MKHDMGIPENVPSFAALAGFFKMSRSTLYEIRHRDTRFPLVEKRGWPVIAVGLLLGVRDLEATSDRDHALQRQANGLSFDLNARKELIEDYLAGIRRNTNAATPGKGGTA